MRYHLLTVELIQNAGNVAKTMGHSCVGSAHLLLAMLQQPGAAGQLLRSMGIDPQLTETMAMVLCGEGTPDLPLPQG